MRVRRRRVRESPPISMSRASTEFEKCGFRGEIRQQAPETVPRPGDLRSSRNLLVMASGPAQSGGDDRCGYSQRGQHGYTDNGQFNNRGHIARRICGRCSRLPPWP